MSNFVVPDIFYTIKIVNISDLLPVREVYVHEELDKRTSLRTTVDSVAFSSSEAMNASWYVPAGKHML